MEVPQFLLNTLYNIFLKKQSDCVFIAESHHLPHVIFFTNGCHFTLSMFPLFNLNKTQPVQYGIERSFNHIKIIF